MRQIICISNSPDVICNIRRSLSVISHNTPCSLFWQVPPDIPPLYNQVRNVRCLHTLLQYQVTSEVLCPTQSQILPLHDGSNSIRFIFSDTSSCFHFCKYVAHIQKLLSDFSQILSAVFIIETQRKYIIFANKIPTCLFFNIMLY